MLQAEGTGRAAVRKGWEIEIDRTLDGGCIADAARTVGVGRRVHSTLAFYFFGQPRSSSSISGIHHQLCQPNGWAMTTNGCAAFAAYVQQTKLLASLLLLLLLLQLLLPS